jgi:molybdenum cofactor cytidylyltransferase/nicotine blue oxidoreductase
VIVGAVLAAGSGSRMGRPKGELVVGGARLVDRAVTALRGGGCADVIAVVREGVDVGNASVVVNPHPDRGLRSSLALAVGAADHATALVVVLADMPGIGADAVRAAVGGWRPGRIVLSRYGEGAGHPIVMEPALWTEALRLAAADEGARRLLVSRPELVDDISVPGDPTDLDTPEDLVRWR